MNGFHEIERITPGPQYNTYGHKQFQALNNRVVHLETILSQHTTQWNAPTLMRAIVEHDTSSVSEYIYAQAKEIELTSADHNAPNQRFEKVVTLDEAYSDDDFITFITVSTHTLGRITGEIYASAINASTFQLYIYTSVPPGAGTLHVHYLTFGKKAPV